MSSGPLTSDEVIRRHYSRSSRGDRAPPYSKQRSLFRLEPEHILECPPVTREEARRRAAHERARAARREDRERQQQAALEKRDLAIFGTPGKPHQGLTRTRTVDVAAHHRLQSLQSLHRQESTKKESRNPSTRSRREQHDRESSRRDDEPHSRHHQERKRVDHQDFYSYLDQRPQSASYRSR